ncbi:MAG: FAD-dependent oxidoreductase [Candidatus Dormibacteria bacterium]
MPLTHDSRYPIVYGASWCPDCHRSLEFLTEQQIPHTWIDIEEHPEAEKIVREKNGGKRIIPTILFEDGSVLVEPSNADLAAQLGIDIRAAHATYDCIVIGSGPAGLAAAVYGARENMSVLVIEQGALGGQAGVTERIDNYLGYPEGIGGKDLVMKMVDHARRYGVELLVGTSVTGVTLQDGRPSVHVHDGNTYEASSVIIATGSHYRRLDVPGEADLIGRGIHFCATCDGPFYRGAKELMVIGGGNSGCEEGLFLADFAERIVLVEASPELRASTLVQEKVRNHPKFDIHTGAAVESFIQGADGSLGGVQLRIAGEEVTMHPDGVFVFIGLEPNSVFLRNSLSLTSDGFIATDERFATSLPGVFAAGDVRKGSTKQLGAAAGEGITALLMVREYLRRLRDSSAVPVSVE